MTQPRRIHFTLKTDRPVCWTGPVLYANAPTLTGITSHVTCGSCKRTKAFQEVVRLTRSQLPWPQSKN